MNVSRIVRECGNVFSELPGGVRVKCKKSGDNFFLIVIVGQAVVDDPLARGVK